MKDNRSFSLGKLAKTFTYAYQGLRYALKKEKNMRIHVTIAVPVVICSFILKITAFEWLFILIAIFGVIALELVNSAIERAIDLATSEIQPVAKQAKDMAAAAVLVYALFAVIIGMIVFGPKLYNLIL